MYRIYANARVLALVVDSSTPCGRHFAPFGVKLAVPRVEAYNSKTLFCAVKYGNRGPSTLVVKGRRELQYMYSYTTVILKEPCQYCFRIIPYVVALFIW